MIEGYLYKCQRCSMVRYSCSYVGKEELLRCVVCSDATWHHSLTIKGNKLMCHAGKDET